MRRLILKEELTMKKLILAAVAASLLSVPALAAPQRNDYRGDAPHHVVVKKKTVVRHAPQRVQYRNWKRGDRFDQRYARNYRQIDYRQYRGLRAPPRGYHYVQSGNDALLVGVTTGIVAAVVANLIR
jgi:Ni/Co efflux regulator RcnB